MITFCTWTFVPAVVRASHYSAIAGMYLLMASILGSVTVVSALAVPGAHPGRWLIPVCGIGLILLWIVVPFAIRERGEPAE